MQIQADPGPGRSRQIRAELRDQEVEKEAVDQHHEENDHLTAMAELRKNVRGSSDDN